jgi:hypothetical protein
MKMADERVAGQKITSKRQTEGTCPMGADNSGKP